MLDAIRPMLLPLRAYAVALAVISVVAFVIGGMLNFICATNNPDVDPYKARAQANVPVKPAPAR